MGETGPLNIVVLASISRNRGNEFLSIENGSSKLTHSFFYRTVLKTTFACHELAYAHSDQGLLFLCMRKTCVVSISLNIEVSKVAKIRNRYNQVPHLTQDTNGKVTNSQKTPQTRATRSVSPFPAGDHEAHINRRAQNIANTRQNKNIKDPQKKYRLGTVSKIFYWRA